MTRKNIVLFDNSWEEGVDFIEGLETATGLPWEAKVCTANGGRKSQFHNFLRYVKYFAFPFQVFLSRRRYDCIIGWQAFYGLIFAFYCRLFRVRKINFLVVKNLTYKPKKGWIGKLYFRFMRYIIKSEYVDIFLCSTRSHCDFCAHIFGEPRERFVFAPFGVMDVSKRISPVEEKEDYILSLGRSNRDWDFLIETLGNTEFPVRIVCDELHREKLPPNIRVYNDVWQERSWEMIRDCACMVIPIQDGSVASGETVLIQAMCFGKPVIAARPGGQWTEYITNGKNGFVVEKDGEALLAALREVLTEEEKYRAISQNCRREYENRFSLLRYGQRVGELVKERAL